MRFARDPPSRSDLGRIFLQKHAVCRIISVMSPLQTAYFLGKRPILRCECSRETTRGQIYKKCESDIQRRPGRRYWHVSGPGVRAVETVTPTLLGYTPCTLSVHRMYIGCTV